MAISGWKGLDLGNGFVTITAEYKDQQHTTRAGPDPRQQYALLAGGAFDPRELTINRFNNWYGEPKMQQYTVYLNSGYDLTDTVHLYACGGYQFRDATSAANVRRPGQQTLANPASNLLAVYPNGFLPKINSQIEDANMAVGVRGTLDDWNCDTSFNYGYNGYHFNTIDSINVSLGPTSPTRFYSGGPRYGQGVLEPGRQPSAEPVRHRNDTNLALGGEVRFENYKINAGEPASYANGGYVTPTGNIGGAGAQGFPGFSPSDAVQARPQLAERLYRRGHPSAGSAGRRRGGPLRELFRLRQHGERQDRRALRLQRDVRPARRRVVGLPRARRCSRNMSPTPPPSSWRATRSTAPSCGRPTPWPPNIGAVPLKPENSVNYSVGGVFRLENFSATLDLYSISVGNRIALSDTISQANVLALFPASAQIGGARFFTNAEDTLTNGGEFVATYKWHPGRQLGRLQLHRGGEPQRDQHPRHPLDPAAVGADPGPGLPAQLPHPVADQRPAQVEGQPGRGLELCTGPA